MILSSPSFNNNAKIPSKFTCDGGNINPEIQIHNVPPETKSLAIIMDDPDAPSGNFTHWLVWNIDPKTEIIKQESVPPGSTEGPNGTGKIGYTGPCPPDKKTHHYFIKLYALKDLIIETENIRNKADLENIFNKFLIEKAELIGTYLRTNWGILSADYANNWYPMKIYHSNKLEVKIENKISSISMEVRER